MKVGVFLRAGIQATDPLNRRHSAVERICICCQALCYKNGLATPNPKTELEIASWTLKL
jgi:hypothetical protein